MQSRMKNPAFVLPGAMDALMALAKPIAQGGLSRTLVELVNLRASQINGCSVCVDMHSRALLKLGEKVERVAMVGAWREAPYFTDAERASLALCESATRLSDRSDPVPDEVWNDAAAHFGEGELAALVLAIAAINLWNRLNATTRQTTGEWVAQYV